MHQHNQIFSSCINANLSHTSNLEVDPLVELRFDGLPSSVDLLHRLCVNDGDEEENITSHTYDVPS